MAKKKKKQEQPQTPATYDFSKFYGSPTDDVEYSNLATIDYSRRSGGNSPSYSSGERSGAFSDFTSKGADSKPLNERSYMDYHNDPVYSGSKDYGPHKQLDIDRDINNKTVQLHNFGVQAPEEDKPKRGFIDRLLNGLNVLNNAKNEGLTALTDDDPNTHFGEAAWKGFKSSNPFADDPREFKSFSDVLNNLGITADKIDETIGPKIANTVADITNMLGNNDLVQLPNMYTDQKNEEGYYLRKEGWIDPTEKRGDSSAMGAGLNAAMGFGGDVVTDPLNYMTLGAKSVLSGGASIVNSATKTALKDLSKQALEKAGVEATEGLTESMARRAATLQGKAWDPKGFSVLGKELVSGENMAKVGDYTLASLPGKALSKLQDAIMNIDLPKGKKVGDDFYSDFDLRQYAKQGNQEAVDALIAKDAMRQGKAGLNFRNQQAANDTIDMFGGISKEDDQLVTKLAETPNYKYHTTQEVKNPIYEQTKITELQKLADQREVLQSQLDTLEEQLDVVRQTSASGDDIDKLNKAKGELKDQLDSIDLQLHSDKNNVSYIGQGKEIKEAQDDLIKIEEQLKIETDPTKKLYLESVKEDKQKFLKQLTEGKNINLQLFSEKKVPSKLEGQLQKVNDNIGAIKGQITTTTDKKELLSLHKKLKAEEVKKSGLEKSITEADGLLNKQFIDQSELSPLSKLTNDPDMIKQITDELGPTVKQGTYGPEGQMELFDKPLNQMTMAEADELAQSGMKVEIGETGTGDNIVTKVSPDMDKTFTGQVVNDGVPVQPTALSKNIKDILSERDIALKEAHKTAVELRDQKAMGDIERAFGENNKKLEQIFDLLQKEGFDNIGLNKSQLAKIDPLLKTQNQISHEMNIINKIQQDLDKQAMDLRAQIEVGKLEHGKGFEGYDQATSARKSTIDAVFEMDNPSLFKQLEAIEHAQSGMKKNYTDMMKKKEAELINNKIKVLREISGGPVNNPAHISPEAPKMTPVQSELQGAVKQSTVGKDDVISGVRARLEKGKSELPDLEAKVQELATQKLRLEEGVKRQLQKLATTTDEAVSDSTYKLMNEKLARVTKEYNRLNEQLGKHRIGVSKLEDQLSKLEAPRKETPKVEGPKTAEESKQEFSEIYDELELTKNIDQIKNKLDEIDERALNVEDHLRQEFPDLKPTIKERVPQEGQVKAVREAPEDIKKIVEKVKRDFKLWGIEEKDAGMLDVIADNYAFHLLNKDLKKGKGINAFFNKYTADQYDAAVTNFNNFKRKYSGSIERINAKIKIEHGIDNFFETSMSRIYFERAIRHNRLMFEAQLQDDIIKGVGKQVTDPKDVPRGWVAIYPEGRYQKVGKKQIIEENSRLAGMSASDIIRDTETNSFRVLKSSDNNDLKIFQEGQAYAVPEPIYKAMTKVGKLDFDESTNAFARVYDKFINYIKAHQTFIRPGFSAGNHLSNQFQNYLAVGSRAVDPKLQGQVAELLLHASNDPAKLANKFVTLDDGTKLSYKILHDEANYRGVLNNNFSYQDVDRFLEDKVNSSLGGPLQKLLTKGNPLSLQFIGTDMMRGVSGTVENHARMVNFIANVQMGKSFDEAVDVVNKFLFDYSDLSDFERTFMKRIIPYYTWMRKNTPLQFEQLLENAHVYRAATNAKNNIESQTDQPLEQYMNDYMQDWVRLPFTTTNKDGQEDPMYWNPRMPLQDLNNVPNVFNLLSDPGKTMKDFTKDQVSSITPPIKLLFETLGERGYDYYFDSPLIKNKGELADAPAYLEKPYQMLPDSLKEKLGILKETKDGEVKMDPKLRHILKTFTSLEDIDKVARTEDNQQSLNIMNLLAGIKAQPFNQAQAAYWAKKRYYEELLAKDKEAQELGNKPKNSQQGMKTMRTMKKLGQK